MSDECENCKVLQTELEDYCAENEDLLEEVATAEYQADTARESLKELATLLLDLEVRLEPFTNETTYIGGYTEWDVRLLNDVLAELWGIADDA